MALADYYLCDVCDAKTFYDANLSYDFKGGNVNPNGTPWPVGNVGWMTVLCKECAKSHSVEVMPKTRASLIVAAPELLEACKRQVANIERWLETGEPADAEESKAIYETLTAAIAKAEGTDQCGLPPAK